jgi:hypothetical protein
MGISPFDYFTITGLDANNGFLLGPIPIGTYCTGITSEALHLNLFSPSGSVR